MHYTGPANPYKVTINLTNGVEIKPSPISAGLIKMVRHYADQIQNGRTISDIYNHARDEMRELDDEINAPLDEPGEDGVIGESIDVILCLVDLIINENPNITSEEIDVIIVRKLNKWLKHYKHSIHRER